MYALETLDINGKLDYNVSLNMLEPLMANKIPIKKLTLRGIQNHQMDNPFFKTMKFSLIERIWHGLL